MMVRSRRGFFARRAAAGHRAVVDAAHPDRIDVLILSVFAHALLPIIQNAVAGS